MPYIGGVGAYHRRICDDVAAKGYEGFAMSAVERPRAMATSQLPSLRANGSRECAPDDRLREAIPSPVEGVDCFVAYAPRNDG
jgi:hypothetical protein